MDKDYKKVEGSESEQKDCIEEKTRKVVQENERESTNTSAGRFLLSMKMGAFISKSPRLPPSSNDLIKDKCKPKGEQMCDKKPRLCEENDRDANSKKMVFRFFDLPRELRDKVRFTYSCRIGMSGRWGHAREIMNAF